MNKQILALCLIAGAALTSFARPTVLSLKENIQDSTIVYPQSFETDTQELMKNWYLQNYAVVDRSGANLSDVPTSDKDFIARLQKMPTVIEMPYNGVVRSYINMYTQRRRQLVEEMLGLSLYYMPFFEQALEKEGVPLELKYLPVIESALNPDAVSRVGATGLWQFMLGTGKIYGLKNNSLIDERRDPVKSTWAAARYLKDLYDIYQDWNLVLAAYNCGPGTINKAIRRAGGATDYWTIYNYLPKETRGYVPAFIAANYIMTYYCEHGICPMETQLPNATDTIHINKDLHLQQVAEVCNINLDQLRSLNPQYKKDIIPGNSELCALRLPNNFVSTFIDRQDSVFAYKPNEYLTKRKTVAIKETTSSRNRSSKGTLYHKIKQGDTLGGIAAKYHVSISQLRNLNGIKGNNIRAGRSLRIR